MATDRLPAPVESALDAGDATMRNAIDVLARADSSIDRSRALLAGADDTIDLADRTLDLTDKAL